MNITPHNIFQTHIASFDISDEPVFEYFLDLNNRLPDELSEEENVTNSLGNTSSYDTYQRSIKMFDNVVKESYEDEEWICVRKEVKNFLDNLGKLYLEMHYSMGKNEWAKARKLEVINLWIVRYMEGDYQAWHNHPQSALSAVLFLEVPDGINKKTFPDGMLHLLSNGIYDQQTLELNHSYFINPEPGLVVIFPSSIGHLAYPFKGPGRRTTISFNLNDDSIMSGARLDKTTGTYLLSGPNNKVYELTEYIDDK
jgi:uncharacterized protein (TIGR02466 family)